MGTSPFIGEIMIRRGHVPTEWLGEA